MNTSLKNPFLSEILDGDKIPLGTLAYFRERFRDRLYDLVMEEFLKQDAENSLTRAEVARRIGRRSEQITRWFAAPGNWTLETVSDLLLAISKSEPEVSLLPLVERATRNYRGEKSPTSLSNKPAESPSPKSVIEANARTLEHSQPYRPPGARIRLGAQDQKQSAGSRGTIQHQGGRHEAACN